MSRDILTLSSYLLTYCGHDSTLSRHREMFVQSRHSVYTITHCQHTSRYGLDTHSGPQRKKMIYILYNGLERFVSECN